MNNAAERLKQLVNETANSSIAISVNEEGWFTTLGNTKQKFTNPDFDKLCEGVSEYILKNRKEKEPTTRSPKKFTL